MKTTVDIPDLLYRRAKILAVEQSTSLKEILLRGLQRELDSGLSEEVKVPYFARRRFLPSFRKLQKSGDLKPRARDRDVTELVSEDRIDRAS